MIGGKYVRLSFPLQGTPNETLIEINDAFSYAWEDYLFDNHDQYLESNNIDMYWYTDVSFSGELDRIVSGDLPVIAAAFGVMIVYLMFTLGKLNCVEARPYAACASILSTISAVIMGFGVGSACGIPFNYVVLLSPFILLGVGVDDDIIIVESLNNTPVPNTPERFANALEHTGLSITITSLSSIVAFAIGSNADIPGVSAFCAFCSLAFGANYCMFFFPFVF